MKNKIILLIAMLTASAMIASAQYNDVYFTEERTSQPYHFIRIIGEVNAKIVQDEQHSVTVIGTAYHIDNTVTILRNDTLFIYQTNTRPGEAKPKIVISGGDIVLLEVTGKSKVDCSGFVNTDYLTVKAKEGAQIKLDVRALKVESRVTGCSFISISGNTVSNVESTDDCGVIDSHLLDVIEKKKVSGSVCPEC